MDVGDQFRVSGQHVAHHGEDQNEGAQEFRSEAGDPHARFAHLLSLTNYISIISVSFANSKAFYVKREVAQRSQRRYEFLPTCLLCLQPP